jgi:hypothetical protein
MFFWKYALKAHIVLTVSFRAHMLQSTPPSLHMKSRAFAMPFAVALPATRHHVPSEVSRSQVVDGVIVVLVVVVVGIAGVGGGVTGLYPLSLQP